MFHPIISKRYKARRGRGVDSSVSFSKQKEKKDCTALLLFSSHSSLFFSFPVFPTLPPTPLPPLPGCVFCCVCHIPSILIVASTCIVGSRATYLSTLSSPFVEGATWAKTSLSTFLERLIVESISEHCDLSTIFNCGRPCRKNAAIQDRYQLVLMADTTTASIP